jgi:LysR family transcriptional regulator, carnitine catabolism transcriptional activator
MRSWPSVAGDDPLTEERAYSWAELVQQPFIAMAPGTSVRALTDAACAQAGLVLQPRFKVAHLAAAGLGVAALPSLILPVLGRSSLVVRELEVPRMVRRIGIVQATGRTPSPAARAFRRLLEATDLPGLLAEADES